MSNVPPQKWCGQTQPHNPHRWAESQSGLGIWMDCAGVSGQEAGQPGKNDGDHGGLVGRARQEPSLESPSSPPARVKEGNT